MQKQNKTGDREYNEKVWMEEKSEKKRSCSEAILVNYSLPLKKMAGER